MRLKQQTKKKERKKNKNKKNYTAYATAINCLIGYKILPGVVKYYDDYKRHES
jgi:hypothetical protein